MEKNETKNPIQVAGRLFLIMELLAKDGAMGLSQISQSVDLNKSTVHRLLNSLMYMGYVRQDATDGKYSMSFKIVNIANQVMEKMDIVHLARPYLCQLMEQTGETVHFVEMDGVDAVYIDKVESHRNSVQMVSRIGNRIPLYRSGVGKAIAATMPDGEVKQLWEASKIEKATPHTITNYQEFYDCLGLVREKGYALDNEENEAGVRCIAAAVPDERGRVRYAFSISAPTNRMDDGRIFELSEYVLRTKEQLNHIYSIS